MIMKKTLILSLAMVVTVVAAKDINDVTKNAIQEASESARQTIDKVMPIAPTVGDERATVTVPDIQNLPNQEMNVISPNAKDPMQVAEQVRQMGAPTIVNPNDASRADLVVFVSMSMPNASLKRIAFETARVGGVMVLRGFVNDSLKQTISATREFANLGAQLQVNPELFKSYNVQSVPTFVLSRNAQEKSSCESQQACKGNFQLEGDASLVAVLNQMSSNNSDKTLSKIASSKLAKLQGIEP